ncbi:MAG: hypothetical protein JXA46_05145 [Dehalococcoidales bacterium]|nr:hypothetical protein [Dehalococcoidales bacterium]
MADQRYLKNFIFSDKKDLKLPPYRMQVDPRFFRRMTVVDKDAIPGGKFYCETNWILPGFGTQPLPPGKKANYWEEHTHDFRVMTCFYGFNYDNIMDLGAEIEFWIDGEKYIIKESFTAFIPAGVKHGPLTIRNVVKPVVHCIACDSPEYK